MTTMTTIVDNFVVAEFADSFVVVVVVVVAEFGDVEVVAVAVVAVDGVDDVDFVDYEDNYYYLFCGLKMIHLLTIDHCYTSFHSHCRY
jgi:hypothetical protein